MWSCMYIFKYFIAYIENIVTIISIIYKLDIILQTCS